MTLPALLAAAPVAFAFGTLFAHRLVRPFLDAIEADR